MKYPVLCVLFISLLCHTVLAEEDTWSFFPGSYEMRGMAADREGVVWISYDDGRIGRFESGVVETYPPETTGLNSGGPVIVDHNNNKWFQGSVLVRYDGASWRKVTTVSSYWLTVRQIAPDRDGTLWIAADQGIVHVKSDLSTDLFNAKNTGITFSSALLAAVDRNNVKWFLLAGSSGGKSIVTFNGTAWRVFNDPSCPVRAEDLGCIYTSPYAPVMAFNNWVFDGSSWFDMGRYTSNMVLDHQGVFWSLHYQWGSVHGGTPFYFEGIWRYDALKKTGSWARSDNYWETPFRPQGAVPCVSESNVKWFDLPGAGIASHDERNRLLAVISPHRGELWEAASSHTVTWYAKNVNRINIEFSPDNGATWRRIAEDIPAFPQSYEWVTPEIDSETCLVRVMDASDPTMTGVCDGAFTIAPPSIRVVSPNGGETLRTGETVTLAWKASLETHVRLEYSTNDGAEWMAIADTIDARAGSYEWTIPDTPGSLCRFRAVDTAEPTRSGMSDRAFTIQAFHPNAIWFNGSTGITIPDNGYLSQSRITLECWVRFENMGWSGSEVEIGVFDQYMLYKEGQEFGKVGFCLGHRRQESGQHLFFRLFSTGFDMYDFYAMSEPINLNSLNWYHVAATFDGRIMKLYLNGDAVAETVIPMTHSFVIQNRNPLIFGFPRGLNGWLDEIRIWSVARTESEIRGTMYDDVSTGNGLVAAWHFDEPGGQSIKDSMKGINGFLGTSMYTPTQDPERVEMGLPRSFVHVTSPRGGESWEAGGTHPITWEARGISTVDISYSQNGGGKWNILAQNIPASSGNWSWKIPDINAPLCLVRVYTSSVGKEKDTSRRAFTISPPLVTVRSPNGGERFRSATTVEITWDSEGMETVDLSYSTDNGTSWILIAAGVPASRKPYFWDLPPVSSECCLVRVTNSSRQSTADTSDGVFTISDFPVRALDFSGNDIVTIPSIPISSPKLITVECWAKFTNLENIGEDKEFYPYTQHVIYQEEVSDESAFSIDYYMYDGTRYLAFRFGRRSWNTAVAKCANPPLIPNTWHHLAGTSDGGRITLYLDGRKIASAYEDWFTISQHPVLFFGHNFSGEVDEVRLWNCARTEEQIRETMLREIDSLPGLTSVWHLRGEDRQVILDSTGKANGYLGSSPNGDIRDPLWVESGSPVSISTDISGEGEHPAAFALFQNTPNPFNPLTGISFSLPSRRQVRLTVYSAAGHKVRELVSGVLDRGVHSFLWDGADESGVPVASGVYLYRLEDGRNMAVRKMVLLK